MSGVRGSMGGAVMMVRRSGDRGRTDLGWLDSKHTFPFGNWHDHVIPQWGTLRVINDDVVKGGGGFSAHGHRDMEIVSIVLEGQLAHRDSASGKLAIGGSSPREVGEAAVIRAGEVQRMSAGRGVVHSEFNASAKDPVHFFQVWITPSERGIDPGYEQRAFDATARRGAWQVIASHDGRNGSLTIHQNAAIVRRELTSGEGATLAIGAGKRAWVHVVSGSVRVSSAAGEEELAAGDGAGVAGVSTIEFSTENGADVIVFETV